MMVGIIIVLYCIVISTYPWTVPLLYFGLHSGGVWRPTGVYGRSDRAGTGHSPNTFFLLLFIDREDLLSQESL